MTMLATRTSTAGSSAIDWANIKVGPSDRPNFSWIVHPHERRARTGIRSSKRWDLFDRESAEYVEDHDSGYVSWKSPMLFMFQNMDLSIACTMIRPPVVIPRREFSLRVLVKAVARYPYPRNVVAARASH